MCSNLLFRRASCLFLQVVSKIFLDYLDPEHSGRKYPQNIGNCDNLFSIMSHNTWIFTDLFWLKFHFAVKSGYCYKRSVLIWYSLVIGLSSTYTTSVIRVKSRRMRWVGYVECVREKRKAYRIVLAETEKGTCWLEDLHIDGIIILKLTLIK